MESARGLSEATREDAGDSCEPLYPMSPSGGICTEQAMLQGDLPGDLFREELCEQVVVVGLELFEVRLGVTLRIEVVWIELQDPRQHRAILLVAKIVIGAVPMPCVERVKAQHVQAFHREVILHDLIDVAVVTEGHFHFVEATVFFVDAEFCLVERVLGVRVGAEKLWENHCFGICASSREGVAYDAPLRFAVEAKELA